MTLLVTMLFYMFCVSGYDIACDHVILHVLALETERWKERGAASCKLQIVDFLIYSGCPVLYILYKLYMILIIMYNVYIVLLYNI